MFWQWQLVGFHLFVLRDHLLHQIFLTLLRRVCRLQGLEPLGLSVLAAAVSPRIPGSQPVAAATGAGSGAGSGGFVVCCVVLYLLFYIGANLGVRH